MLTSHEPRTASFLGLTAHGFHRVVYYEWGERDNPDVVIDHARKRITIRIPPAKLIAIEVRDMRTYDERGGLWNPFTREDRDAIQRQARAQLMAAGGELALLRHANESAVELLKMLLAKDGYTVDVALRGI